nr:hypothetical protein [Desulfobacula sp.]
MKKKSIFLSVSVLMLIFALFSGPGLADQKPEADLSEPVFNFQTAWEGDTVSHDFIMKNKGAAPWKSSKSTPTEVHGSFK